MDIKANELTYAQTSPETIIKPGQFSMEIPGQFSVEIDSLEALRDALANEGTELAILAPKIGGVRPKSGKPLAADMALSGAPSVFFDAVAIFASAEGIKPLLKNSAAIDWIRDAFAHLKVIGYTADAKPIFEKAGIANDLDEGVIELDARASIGQYIEAAKQQRVWAREARLAESDA
jgi:catalase